MDHKDDPTAAFVVGADIGAVSRFRCDHCPPIVADRWRAWKATPGQRLAARMGAQAGDHAREWRRRCVLWLMLDVCPLVRCEVPRPPTLGVANLENGALGVEM